MALVNFVIVVVVLFIKTKSQKCKRRHHSLRCLSHHESGLAPELVSGLLGRLGT